MISISKNHLSNRTDDLHVGDGTVIIFISEHLCFRAGRDPRNHVIPSKLRPVVSKQFSGCCMVTYGLCWDLNPGSHLHSSVAHVIKP